jgi:hypothetical protein
MGIFRGLLCGLGLFAPSRMEIEDKFRLRVLMVGFRFGT